VLKRNSIKSIDGVAVVDLWIGPDVGSQKVEFPLVTSGRVASHEPLAGDIIRRNCFKLPELLIPTTFRLVSTTLILRIGLRGLIWELLDDQALTEHLVQDASVEPTALEVTLGDDAVKVELLRWLFLFIVAALNLSVVDGVAEEVGSRLTLPTSKPRL
jgi:hypothetical protein